MAAKGTEAKAIIEAKIAEIFGGDYVGNFDKKLYVNVKESSGETVQVAFALTCPKVPIGGAAATSNETSVQTGPVEMPKSEITEDEVATVNALMEKLGL